jgi:hypothetical protein
VIGFIYGVKHIYGTFVVLSFIGAVEHQVGARLYIQIAWGALNSDA